MNIKKYYYKNYFDDLPFRVVKHEGKEKLEVHYIDKKQETEDGILARNIKLCNASLIPISNPIANKDHSFKLKVCYPGLVTGVGINHETGIDGEYKLGMHFDHTTGMPIVYGSSVKGVIRTYFKEEYKPKNGEPGIDEAFIDIFGSDEKHNSCYTKSIYERDIFFDAVIVKENGNGNILAPDSITPHKEGPLKNPNPITFIKIASGCEIEFRFRLSSTRVDDKILTTQRKLELFKQILTTYGIGAKTNVGYGQLTVVK